MNLEAQNLKTAILPAFYLTVMIGSGALGRHASYHAMAADDTATSELSEGSTTRSVAGDEVSLYQVQDYLQSQEDWHLEEFESLRGLLLRLPQELTSAELRSLALSLDDALPNTYPFDDLISPLFKNQKLSIAELKTVVAPPIRLKTVKLLLFSFAYSNRGDWTVERLAEFQLLGDSKLGIEIGRDLLECIPFEAHSNLAEGIGRARLALSNMAHRGAIDEFVNLLHTLPASERLAVERDSLAAALRAVENGLPPDKTAELLANFSTAKPTNWRKILGEYPGAATLLCQNTELFQTLPRSARSRALSVYLGTDPISCIEWASSQKEGNAWAFLKSSMDSNTWRWAFRNAGTASTILQNQNFSDLPKEVQIGVVAGAIQGKGLGILDDPQISHVLGADTNHAVNRLISGEPPMNELLQIPQSLRRDIIHGIGIHSPEIAEATVRWLIESDPKNSMELLNGLWADFSPEEMSGYVLTSLEHLNEGEKERQAISVQINRAAENLVSLGGSPSSAIAYVDQIPQPFRTSAIATLAKAWSKQDAAGVSAWLAGLDEPAERSAGARELLPALAHDPVAYEAWADVVNESSAN